MQKIQVAFLGLVLFTFVIVCIILSDGAAFMKHISERFERFRKIRLDNGLASPADEIVNTSGSENGTKPKLILFYTSYFGRVPWPGLQASDNLNYLAHPQCAVRSCRISFNKSNLAFSDVVIFHGRDMPRVAQRSEKRHPKQKWAFYIRENPHHVHRDLETYNGFFNWMITYKRDSDVVAPYGSYARLGSEDEVPKAGKNYAEGKDKLVAWAVSNCGHTRENFVRKLMQYIPVDVYGACARQFGQTQACGRFSSKCGQILKRYKFYLSFENSFCDDYITEKYWDTPFEHDMVPVVMGGANYDSRVAIPGSFINVVDFPSIEELAHYLLYLSRNDTAYSQFFQWKMNFKHHFSVGVQQWPWICQLCAILNNNTISETNKVYQNFHEFWSVRDTCGKNVKKIREMISA